MTKRDRSNQISLDFTNHLEAKKVYDKLPHKNKTAWISDAIIEKSEREKGIVFTEAQIEYLNKYYIRKEGV